MTSSSTSEPRNRRLSRSGLPSRRGAAGVSLGLAAMLLLSGCETASVEESSESSADAGVTSGGPQEPQAPEPRGNQLSHEEMREVLRDRYPDATLTDSDDYWEGLRQIETELQRLVVDPIECKQLVVRSAVPVPAGSLVAFADAPAGGDGAPANEGDGGGSESDEGGDSGDGGSSDGGSGEEPEASGEMVGSGQTVLQLANTEDESEDGGESGDSGGGDSDGNPGEDSDGNSADDSDEDAEEDAEPVTVNLPGARQAAIYTFRDWRSADAQLSAEKEGVETCDSYTSDRAGDDAEEVATSVETVELSSDADAALGMTRRISADGPAQHSAAVSVRMGSHIATVLVPLEDSLSEEEAEVAVVELEEEALGLLEGLD